MTEQQLHTCALCQESSLQVSQVIRSISDFGDDPHYLCPVCLAWEDSFYDLLDELTAGRMSREVVAEKAQTLLDELTKRVSNAPVEYYKDELVEYDVEL